MTPSSLVTVITCDFAERRNFLQKHYHFDIDGGAPLPPPPAWQEPALGGAHCEWRPAAPPGPLDPADLHLTALQSPGMPCHSSPVYWALSARIILAHQTGQLCYHP